MTSFYQEIPENVQFEDITYEKLAKEERLDIEELELLNVLDVNGYKKE